MGIRDEIPEPTKTNTKLSKRKRVVKVDEVEVK